MKKIDFHIHTVSTKSDKDFIFSLETLKKYIGEREIDGIAITNHNCFDLVQFETVKKAVSATIFPGIEVDLAGGHILVIADGSELSDFDARCRRLEAAIPSKNHSIAISDFRKIFPDLSKYLLIPHYGKNPHISDEILEELRPFVTAGEVTSPKKFIYCVKDTDSLVPVYFSDLRVCEALIRFPTRQTYIDADKVDFAAIRTCFRDKNKVFLSREDGNKFFDALDNGLRLSTGLNVILGGRSTGKSFTLDQINEAFEGVKYIKQFSLLQRDETEDRKQFHEMLTKRESIFTQQYLREFKEVVDDMVSVDLEKDERLLEKYISSLLKNAREHDKKDSYSSSKLFDEDQFIEIGSGNLKALIDATILLIENIEYRETIERRIPMKSLKGLAIELMKRYLDVTVVHLKKIFLNHLLKTIRKALRVRTAATPIEDVDLYRIAMARKKVEKFHTVVEAAKCECEILRKDVQGFQLIAKRKGFGGAGELRKLSKRMMSFSDAFSLYGDSYAYLKGLRQIEDLEESEYFKFFIKIEHGILNKHGFNVSGGERSEFQLLYQIDDAQQSDMLLIDEPESSFDNIFLLKNVNELIKQISKSIPVVLVTHNNTVGASIKPNYVVFTQKIKNGEIVKYELYTGYPSSEFLTGLDGKKIRNLDVLMNCLEAGQSAYDERGGSYEILKDRRQ